jgi:hypothetical protein
LQVTIKPIADADGTCRQAIEENAGEPPSYNTDPRRMQNIRKEEKQTEKRTS